MYILGMRSESLYRLFECDILRREIVVLFTFYDQRDKILLLPAFAISLGSVKSLKPCFELEFLLRSPERLVFVWVFSIHMNTSWKQINTIYMSSMSSLSISAQRIK